MFKKNDRVYIVEWKRRGKIISNVDSETGICLVELDDGNKLRLNIYNKDNFLKIDENATTKTIYVPKGKALEYSPLACNLYVGCTHACKYCYGPNMMRCSFEDWTKENLTPRDNILDKLENDAKKLAGDPREILFSFTSDPYFNEEASALTRKALEICDKYGLNAQVLTKAGKNAVKDFDLFAKNGWRFGSTIIFIDEKLREEWETGAPSIASRIDAIKKAKEMGIFTWVSVEPVVDADEALRVMDELKGFVDLWKVGKLNHFKEIEETIDWQKFLADSIQKLNGERVYYKNDLVETIRK